MNSVYAIALDSGYHTGAGSEAASLFEFARELDADAELYLLRMEHSTSPLPATALPYTLLTADYGGAVPAQCLGKALHEALPDVPALWLFGMGGLDQQVALFFAAARGLPAAVRAIDLTVGADSLTWKRMAYAGNLTAKLQMPVPAVVAFVKGALAGKVHCRGAAPRAIQHLKPMPPPADLKVQFERVENPLLSAKRVIAAGRGVTSRQGLERLKRIADNLQAEIAISRPIAMNGWLPISRQIGISGETISPDICLLVGISGSSAFLYGIRGAKQVLAVNTDSSAAVFSRAQQGSIAGWEEFCILMEQHLASKESKTGGDK